MTIQELRTLASHAVRRTAPENFSVSSVDAGIAEGFKTFCGSINAFMKNRYDIYDIIIQNADEVVPAKVMEAMAPFAEIIQLKNGEKRLFKRGTLGRQRAKKFLTQVGLNGLYETFRLDSDTFELRTKAIGGAVSIDFQRMVDGAENLSEFMDVLAEAQVDGIYAEVQKALISAINLMPSANTAEGTYNPNELHRIINTVKAYGGGATIFASPEFVADMGPDAIVPGGTGFVGVYSPDDIEAIHRFGSVKMFRGTPIVEFRQSFLDENNEQKMIHPAFAYVLPSGKEKVVKIAMEGPTQMYDIVNADQSIEVHTYKMIGVGILSYNNWGVYCNTTLMDKVENNENGYAWYSEGDLGLFE